ncbi:tumor necrosis factor receptor superfamily member 6-like isoform X2 [Hemicordylus capensis]|uniref:tumor necrosis factor receptor superfamily member 6-like isoform X2 n=1 Tax=Hemicordylus capensis TaxID=884348 RepID=UPI0023047C4E|nr:tumor necrosis factor receptor superfamily member 6-like isoform X2 [Hemicordylus capensis]
MAMKRALLFTLALLVAEVESPSLHLSCEKGEYAYSGRCCKKCPAGTCKDCTAGEDYTAYENSLDHCLRCEECRSGKRMVRPCTVTSNTECQCNDGYYCPPGCEECLRCTEKCPEGQTLLRKCNATANIECGVSPEEATYDVKIVVIIVFVIVAVAVAILTTFLWLCKKEFRFFKEDKVKESQDLLVPEATRRVVIVTNASHKELKSLYFGIRDEVPQEDYKTLVRKMGLSDNDITRICRDNPYHADEQDYQMLKTLQDKLGIERSLCGLLDALWDMKLKRIYENLLNQLISNDIVTMETKE